MQTQDILNERRKTHGNFNTQAKSAQNMKDIARGGDVWNTVMDDSQREAIDMILHKISRITNGNPHEVDHWRDIQGYAKLCENLILYGSVTPPDEEK